MTGYQSYTEQDPFSKDPRQSAAIPAPPGYDVDDTTRELAREVPDLLPRFGLVTPWALRRGDVEWVQLTQPQDANLELFRISDATIKQIFTQLFGLELPYLAVLTKRALTQTQVSQAFANTSYGYMQTMGVYAQTDKQLNPRAFYLHWLKRQGVGKGGKGGPGRAAQTIGGTLLFAQQVSAAKTTLRQPPVLSFADSQLKAQIARLPPSGIATQALFIPQVGGIGDAPQPATPAPAAQFDYATPALLLAASAGITYMLFNGK